MNPTEMKNGSLVDNFICRRRLPATLIYDHPDSAFSHKCGVISPIGVAAMQSLI